MAEASTPKKLYIVAFVVGAVLTYVGLLVPQPDFYLNVSSLLFMLMLAAPILVCRNTSGAIATFFGSFVGLVAYTYLHTAYFVGIVVVVFRFAFLQLFAFAAMILVESQTKLGKLVAGVAPAALYVSLSVLATLILAFTPFSQTVDWGRYGTDSVWLLTMAGLYFPLAHEILKESAENSKKPEGEHPPIGEIDEQLALRIRRRDLQ